MSGSKPYAEREVKSLEDLRKLLDQYSYNWIFRGQACSDWSLTTTIERCGLTEESGVTQSELETWLLSEFKAEAHAFISGSRQPQNDFEWYALMQNHGAPTRLLDWTLSFYIALYFAMEDCHENECDSCALWAVETEWLRVQLIVGLQIRNPVDRAAHFISNIKKPSDIPAAISSNFKDMILGNEFTFTAPIPPITRNLRESIQNSYYLCMGNLKLGFMENLLSNGQDNLPRHFHKIVIPCNLQRETLFELSKNEYQQIDVVSRA